MYAWRTPCLLNLEKVIDPSLGGLCRRLAFECEYREPLATKKDKTMVHILDALTRLENKFDNLSMVTGSSPDGPDRSTPAVRTTSAASSSMSAMRSPQMKPPPQGESRPQTQD
ncbi:hypothetical protein LTR56_027733 [Elasticomyces elasticus]|nr:hypothetical protein LTR56_027733 [Elasticomyces elasticus]KAK4896366.1 hypothetical protein LTR49_028142 [Elasticomyces elasticus]